MTPTYLIYGANGYTGELIAREAKARGQTPILSGRNAAAVRALADELGLPQRAFDLDDAAAVDAGLADVGAVLNCAGPFVRTARPMVDACVRRRVHYLDVTGEVDVFEALAARDNEARAAGVSLLPGVGFDVVPTDCLAAHLKRRMPEAQQLSLGFQALMGLSRGTATTTIEGIGKPNLVRRGGVLTPEPFGKRTRVIDFGRGPATAVSIPWGDVSTAYHSTGIPNIEVFVSIPAALRFAMGLNDAFSPFLRSHRVQAGLKALVRAGKPGPDAAARARGRSYLWGEACDAAGSCVSTRLQTPEGYTLTVQTALAAVNKLLGGPAQPGFLTPSRAFGPDFILEIPDVTRTDL
ncbi:MAG TPA: saccharopine dehydrogenase NADP-binding domain-containing protein [Polyangiales bacterium]|nr:saccharopine dehydrogenase NADP-binding domain-containing protein [Polyangiales bacterium]